MPISKLSTRSTMTVGPSATIALISTVVLGTSSAWPLSVALMSLSSRWVPLGHS